MTCLKLTYVLVLSLSFVIGNLAQTDQCSTLANPITIDAPMKQIIYGNNTHYLLTTLNTVYQSQTGGKSWVNIMPSLLQSDKVQPGFGQKGVSEIIKTSEDGHMMFLGFGFQYWTTKDGIQYFYNTTDAPWISMSPHPTQPDTLLGTRYGQFCTDLVDCYQTAWVSQDLGDSWVEVQAYVKNAVWALSSSIYLRSVSDDLQVGNQVGIPQEEFQLFRFDNFGTKRGYTSEKGCVDFLYNEQDHLYVVYSQGDHKRLEISTDGGNKFTTANFEGSNSWPVQSGKYQILDDSEGVSFMLSQTIDQFHYGWLYEAKTEDPSFWASLKNLRVSDQVPDFYPVKGLDGIYLANQYSGSILAIENQPDRDQYLSTVISLNKGATWSSLGVPAQSSCVQSSCELHLSGNVGGERILSNSNAIGLVLANGNEGVQQSTLPDQVNLYLSRDGAISWEKIRSGPQVFSWGNFGGLFVSANKDQSTKDISYSWTQGISWDTCTLSTKTSINIAEIQPIPGNASSPQFLLFGSSIEDGIQKGVVSFLDFSASVSAMKPCNTDVNDAQTDFEFWRTQWDGTCLLGNATTFPRRKQSAQCVIPSSYDARFTSSSSCECTRQDYTCEGGCWTSKKGDNGETLCVDVCEGLAGNSSSSVQPENCKGTYTKHSGYQKVYGDSCVGDLEDFQSQEVPCENALVSDWFAWVSLLTFLTLCAIAVFFVVLVAFYRKNDDLKEKLDPFIPEWCTRPPLDLDDVSYSHLNAEEFEY